ncbi:MAG: HlyC/CorC family transporter [Prolixibacteraceae bacterium]|jgi:CBS domain containing-hemolysin-like protein|nr:HlyC/CorC family transporter [Prolixibacteraceae bacterium]
MSAPVIILITIIFSAFFSGMEIAFVSANKLSLEMDKKQGNLTAGILNIFTSNPGQYIATMLVGNNIALVIYGMAVARLLEPQLESFIDSDILILLINTLLSTIVILFTAEFLPKTLFRFNANGFLKAFSLPVLFFYIILYPVSHFSMFVSKKMISLFFKTKINSDNENKVFTKVDLDHYINQPDNPQMQNNTEDEETEITLFKNALDFSNIKVRDCMVPRTEIQAVDEETPLEQIRQLFIKTGYSKILVYRESIDNIIGYVHTLQMFDNASDIKKLINAISIVPETMSVSKLLGIFTQKRKSIAIVVDEFGGTSGLITTEDILEEIFGDIEDEHDVDELVTKQIKDNEWILSARHEINWLNEKYHFNLPENDEYDTLAGLIIDKCESIPKINALINIENFEFRVLKASDIRIELVLMKIF